MDWKSWIFITVLVGICGLHVALCRYDVWNEIPCNQAHLPDNCDLKSLPLVTVEDYDRCGPGFLPLYARNHFMGASGRRTTYTRNKDSFDRIQIMPNMLMDVSNHSVTSSALDFEVELPIGVCPVAYQQLAHPDGEIETVRGLSAFKTIMILSMYANKRLEDVALAVQKDGYPHMWMQIYLYNNRSVTIGAIRRAENAGYKAIVFTVDAPILGTVTCNSRATNFPSGISVPNSGGSIASGGLAFATFDDVAWFTKHTSLPVIVKGILRGSDAVKALKAGASAIVVSNHGGRQLDGVPATIDALPGVVKAVKAFDPTREVYMDGGIRSGKDVFKALGRGAKMVFVGRPIIWGMAINGADGVNDVMRILKKELNETMLLAGIKNVNEIPDDILIQPPNDFYI